MKCKDVQVSLANGGTHADHLLSCADCRRFAEDVVRIESHRGLLHARPSDELRHRIREKIAKPHRRRYIGSLAIAGALAVLIVGPTVPVAYRRLSGHEVRGESLGNYQPYHALALQYFPNAGGKADHVGEFWNNGDAMRGTNRESDEIMFIRGGKSFHVVKSNRKISMSEVPNVDATSLKLRISVLSPDVSLLGQRQSAGPCPAIKVFGRVHSVVRDVYGPSSQKGVANFSRSEVYRDAITQEVVRRLHWVRFSNGSLAKVVIDIEQMVPPIEKFDPANLKESKPVEVKFQSARPAHGL